MAYIGTPYDRRELLASFLRHQPYLKTMAWNWELLAAVKDIEQAYPGLFLVEGDHVQALTIPVIGSC